MILRHPPAFLGMSAFYTDSETGAALLNVGNELADDNDVYVALSNPELEPYLDRMILEICEDKRRRGEKLTPLWLHAELEAFQRNRKGRVA